MPHVLRIGVLTFLALLPIVSLAQTPTDAERLFSKGEEFLQSDNYIDAIKEFEKAISLKPDFAEAYFKLGVAHSKIPITDKDRPAHVEAAIRALQMAVRLKPAFVEAHNELGLRTMSQGKYDDAAASFKEAIRLKPDFVDAHTNLAIVHLYKHNYREGIERLKEAIRIKPDLPLPHKLLALGYLALENRDEAMKEYNVLKPLDQEMANFVLAAIQRPEKFVFGVAQGKLISTPKPAYPAFARANRIAGRVTVQLEIDTEGKVTSARAVSGPAELRAAAEAAALGARFLPTRLSGMAVSVTGVISYDFAPY
jgi:protein O-GlcNAc transferase